jgi:hypothetical protein
MKKGTLIGLGIAGIVSGVLAYLYLTPSGQSLLNSSGLSEYLPSGSAFTTFGSSGSSGGIGSTPSDVYDYISPSNNPNNLSNSQAFKSNYKQLGAIVSSPIKIPASQIPIGYKEKPSTIINNPKYTDITTTTTKIVTNNNNNNNNVSVTTSNGQQPYFKVNSNGSVTSNVNLKPVSGTGNLSSAITAFKNQYKSALSTPAVHGIFGFMNPNKTNLPTLNISSTSYKFPAIQLQNGSIFPFINASNSSTNSSLLYNGTAYAGNYFLNNKSGNYFLPLNNSQIAKLNNVTNNSYILNAQNVSAINKNNIIASLNKSNTTISHVNNSNITIPAVSNSSAQNISNNSQLINNIEHLNRTSSNSSASVSPALSNSINYNLFG